MDKLLYDILKQGIELKDGEPEYFSFDPWRTFTNPHDLITLTNKIHDVLSGKDYEVVAGVGDGGYVLASAFAVQHRTNLAYIPFPFYPWFGDKYCVKPRAGVKDKKVVVFSDMLTHGMSFYHATKTIDKSGGNISSLIVLMDLEWDDELANQIRRRDDFTALSRKSDFLK
jgi:orotate phosphoribosyltransferase